MYIIFVGGGGHSSYNWIHSTAAIEPKARLEFVLLKDTWGVRCDEDWGEDRPCTASSGKYSGKIEKSLFIQQQRS